MAHGSGVCGWTARYFKTVRGGRARVCGDGVARYFFNHIVPGRFELEVGAGFRLLLQDSGLSVGCVLGGKPCTAGSSVEWQDAGTRPRIREHADAGRNARIRDGGTAFRSPEGGLSSIQREENESLCDFRSGCATILANHLENRCARRKNHTDRVGRIAAGGIEGSGRREVPLEQVRSAGDYKERRRLVSRPCFRGLKKVPEELVVNLVMVLHFRGLHERPERTRTAVGSRLLQIRIARLNVLAQ